ARFRTLAATKSDKADAWLTLGQDYLEIAKPLIARLSADYRTSAWAERMAGDVLAQRHLWNDAGFAYRQALTTEPAQPGLDAALGEALLRSEEHTSELQSRGHLVCRLLLEKKKKWIKTNIQKTQSMS